MKMTPLDRVLFDPVSWVHPSRLDIPAIFRHGYCRSIMNDAALAKFKFSTVPRSEPLTRIAKLMVDNWFLLPRVALLMSCQRQRAALAYQGAFESLPGSVKSFIQLELVPSCYYQCVPTLDIDYLHSHSLQELLSFNQHLPVFLIERLPFLFQEQKKSDAMFKPLPSTILPDWLFIHLAIQHAKHHRF